MRTLDDILRLMQEHQTKKRPLLRSLVTHMGIACVDPELMAAPDLACCITLVLSGVVSRRELPANSAGIYQVILDGSLLKPVRTAKIICG